MSLSPVAGAILLAVAVWVWPRPASGQPRSRRRDGCGDHGPGTCRDHAPGSAPGSGPGPGPGAVDGAALLTLDAVASTMAHVAVALRGGGGVLESLEIVAATGPPAVRSQLQRVAAAWRWGLDQPTCWAQASPSWRPLAGALALADRSGAAPADLVDRAADDVRREAARVVDERVAASSVRLVLPLGLAFLPAFLLTSIVPAVAFAAAALLTG
jgi:hypothetical protein